MYEWSVYLVQMIWRAGKRHLFVMSILPSRPAPIAHHNFFLCMYFLFMQVREQNVYPVRMIWRGGKRHAFLLFEKREDAEHALSTLEGMEIDGREVKVSVSWQSHYVARS